MADEQNGTSAILAADTETENVPIKPDNKQEDIKEDTTEPAVNNALDSQETIVDGLDAELKLEAEEAEKKEKSNTNENGNGNDEKLEFVVVGMEDGTQMMEIPLEDEQLLSLSTLAHSFPGATGLKYKSPQSGFFRALKVDPESKMHPPSDGWKAGPFVVIVGPPVGPTPGGIKRKLSDSTTSAVDTNLKRVRSEDGDDKCVDLICLNVSFSTFEDALKAFFEKEVGKLAFAQVKKNFDGRHAGFAFIQFKEVPDQEKALAKGKFDLDGREILVKVPESQGRRKRNDTGEDRSYLRKIFVGRVTKDVKEDDLRKTFEKYGTIENIAISLNKNCAFVLFDKETALRDIVGKEFTINGVNVRVERAQPPKNHNMQNQRGGGGGGGGRFFEERGGGRPQFDRRGGPPDNRYSYGGGGRGDYHPPPQQGGYGQQQQYFTPQTGYAGYGAPTPAPAQPAYYDPYRSNQGHAGYGGQAAPAPVAAAPTQGYGSYYPPREQPPQQTYYAPQPAAPAAPRPYEPPPVEYNRAPAGAGAHDRGYASYR